VLSCKIYKTSVSFLIDTGASVSLLNKNVWDYVKPVAGELKQVTSHSLVGVDGMPLAIHGSITLPITISGVTFNHNLIIADRLTAEAILGLDFLEANKCVLGLVKDKMIVADQSVSLLPKCNGIEVLSSTVTVPNTYVIPSHSEMEIVAHIQLNEEGTWLVEEFTSPTLPIMVARMLTTPQD